MAMISADHINPFLMAAKKVFQDMCFVELSIQKPKLQEAKFGPDAWVIIIGVTGEMRGQVLIAMTNENACNEFACSALSELGNMIMGNAATVFSANGIGIDITPPSLTHGTMSFTNNYTKNLCVPMTFDGREIELFLALRQED